MRKRRTLENLVGQTFGRLTVQKELYPLPNNFSKSKQKYRWWICDCLCGNTNVLAATGSLKTQNPVNMGTKSCGCLRKETMARTAKTHSGPNHSRYKGRTIHTTGYVMVYVEDAKNYSESRNGKYVFEHTYVMAKHLNRPLKAHENVHHINGNKVDNKLENLELWSTNQPSGQRVEDKTKWAIEWLKNYSPDTLAK